MRQVACVLLGLFLASPVYADKREPLSVAPKHQIALQPSPLARLAATQSSVSPYERLDFASITLRVLRDSYSSELQRSFDEPAHNAKRRRKLARWQAATRALIETLDEALWRLHDGVELRVQVDARQQVILVIDGRPFAVSGPNPSADRSIEREVVADYCARHDCRILDTDMLSQPNTNWQRGNWDLRQGKRPAFVVGTLVRCEFTSFERRRDKEQACLALSVELRSLRDSLRRAADAGHWIDWDTVEARGPTACRNGALVINPDGSYLKLQAPLCARIGAPDWRHLVEWLRQSGTSTGAEVVIGNADQLLGQ